MPEIVLKAHDPPSRISAGDASLTLTETGSMWLDQGRDNIFLGPEQVAQLTQALITLKNTGKLP